MRITLLKLFAAVWFVASVAQASAAQPQAASPHELDDAENVSITKADDKALPARFNYGRHFLVSVNRGIPGAAALKGEIIKDVSQAGMLDRVLFESFGTESPARVEVRIGKRVPFEIARAVIRALAGRPDLAVYVHVYTDDNLMLDGRPIYFAYTQRVIVGGLGKSQGKPLTGEKAAALLREGITRKEFFKLLSESK
jgi:hypothetical protein